MRFGRFVHRLAAGLAAFSLLGWLELPSEHIHAKAEHDHDVEYVHRHVEIHVPHLPGHATVDHDEDAIYFTGSAAALTRRDTAGPDAAVLQPDAAVVVTRPSDAWLSPPLVVHIHAPPWRTLYCRRGPPAFAV